MLQEWALWQPLFEQLRWIAGSAVLAAILLELVYQLKTGKPLYTWWDTRGNLLVIPFYILVAFIWGPVVYWWYDWAFQARIIDWEEAWFASDKLAFLSYWACLFLLEDFTFYLFHRSSHKIRLLWASHVVHHSSLQFNFTVAWRESWLPFFVFWFWMPLPLLGFHPLSVLLMQAISLYFQVFIHTQAINHLGPLEWVFNTPNHHRVHHASNPTYIDKNFAGVLIIWDKLFNTYQKSGSEPIRFGITQNMNSNRPLAIQFHEYQALWQDVKKAPSFSLKLGTLFKGPGWQANSQSNKTMTKQNKQ
jgi:hypothetical protein